MACLGMLALHFARPSNCGLAMHAAPWTQSKKCDLEQSTSCQVYNMSYSQVAACKDQMTNITNTSDCTRFAMA